MRSPRSVVCGTRRHRPSRAAALSTLASPAILFLLAPLAAAQESPQSTSVFEMFFWADDAFGALNIWFLILMSVVTVALILKLSMDNRRSVMMPVDSVKQYQELLNAKRFREAVQKAGEDRSLFGQIMNATLAEAANGFPAMERAIEEEADLLGSQRLRSVEYLSVLGAVGPMLGLFGTVYGMIVAFQQIVAVKGSPDPSDLAGGISTALITTFWGLIIGIPAVAAASLIRNKIDALIVEMMIQAELLIGPLSPTGRKTAPGVSVPQVKA
jgi:biopolymer transport protein ExbB